MDSQAVGVVSNCKLTRKALVYLLLSLSLSFELCIGAEADTIEEVAEDLVAAKLDVLLIDVEGTDDPLRCVRRVRELSPSTKSLLITDDGGGAFAVQAVRSGAWGLVTKREDPAVLQRAIQRVADGEMWFSHGTIAVALQAISDHKPSEDSPLERLTSREMGVISLLSKGFQNKEIASRLNLSVNTVRRYTEAIYRKLGVSSRLEAALCYQGNSDQATSAEEGPHGNSTSEERL